MATLDELIPRYRFFMRTYRFARYRIPDEPHTRLAVPLARARVALVTTAGLHTSEQAGFDPSDKKGDPSFREIPSTVRVGDLVESHKSDAFDHAGIERDRNLAFPLDRFRELVASGVVGELGPRHLSFMGSIVDPTRLIEETAPAAARLLAGDGVDVALLTPV